MRIDKESYTKGLIYLAMIMLDNGVDRFTVATLLNDTLNEDRITIEQEDGK